MSASKFDLAVGAWCAYLRAQRIGNQAAMWQALGNFLWFSQRSWSAKAKAAARKLVNQ